MKRLILPGDRSCALVPVLGILLLSGCVRSTVVIPEAGGSIGYGYSDMVTSEMADQLDDGGWVTNVPGYAHTHRVVLAECPQQPVVVQHVHNHLQEAQLGAGLHKHRGCYVCPPGNSLVKRILGH